MANPTGTGASEATEAAATTADKIKPFTKFMKGKFVKGAGIAALGMGIKAIDINSISMGLNHRTTSMGGAVTTGLLKSVGSGLIAGGVASTILGAPASIGIGAGVAALSAVSEIPRAKANLALTPFSILSSRRGKGKLDSGPILSAVSSTVHAPATMGLSMGAGILGGGIAGALTKGGKVFKNIAKGIGYGALAGAAIGIAKITTGIGKLAAGLDEMITSSINNSGNSIRGSYNRSKDDMYSTTNLVQALHRVRHKRVL